MTEFEYENVARKSNLNVQPVDLRRVFQLPLPFSERRLLLMLLDMLAIDGALLLALALRPEYHLTWPLIRSNPLWIILLNTIWFPLAFAFEAYAQPVVGRFIGSFKAALKAGAASAAIYLLVPYVTPLLPPSRVYIFVFFFLVLFFLFLGRGLYALALTRETFYRRTLIVGAGEAGHTIAKLLSDQCENSYQLVGFVDDDLAKQDDSLNVLGGHQDLPALIRRYRVNTLILAITRGVSGELLQDLIDCLELGVEIQFMPVLYEQLTGRVPVEHVGGHWSVAMPINHPGTGNLWRLVKRLFDLISASAGMLCLGLAFPFLAAAIYLDSPGPIFYTQNRVGKGGKIFKVYKFRSMRPDAENGKAIWATEKDDRITRVGKILRKMHVDEFPQFINILKGEMSAVGPRPERPEFVEELTEEIPFYRVRHAVKPGMAGWGLVKQGYGSSKEDALLKLQYDLYYIKHQSLGLDIVILLKTILDTVTFSGR